MFYKKFHSHSLNFHSRLSNITEKCIHGELLKAAFYVCGNPDNFHGLVTSDRPILAAINFNFVLAITVHEGTCIQLTRYSWLHLVPRGLHVYLPPEVVFNPAIQLQDSV